MLKLLSALFFLIFLAACQPLTRVGDGGRQLDQSTIARLPVSERHSSPVAFPGPETRQQVNESSREQLDLPVREPLSQELAGFLQQRPVLPYFGDFPLSQHPRISRRINLYSGPQKKMFVRWLERSARYLPRIQLIFAAEGLPLDLAYLAMIESGFVMRAYSWAHAAGPWQFIESTGRMYGLDNNWWQDERLDLEKSTRAAAKHLKYLHQRFAGDWYLAVAAYNAGGGKVSRAVRASGTRDFWALIEGNVLREETRDYLPKLLATLRIVSNPEAYGFSDLQPKPPLEYDVVTVETSTDLEIIAEFSGVSYQQIKGLNPGLKRWCTPPGVKDYRLRVPAGTGDQVARLYAALAPAERARYYRHKLQAGDTLGRLAKRYKIRVDDIIALNNIRNPRTLQIGQNLILPLRDGFSSLPVDELRDSYARSRRRTYKVRSGDNLWAIARRFDVTQKQLRVWNKLGWSNLLQPGQILAVSRSNSTGRKVSGGTRKMVYQVVPGDTLWDIGREFDVATEQIRQWNDLEHDDLLIPGQKLTLLVSARRQG
jgi:membrane-bound lytic murein transglycosylase D